MLDLRLILTISCDRASHLASDALDRKLSLSERIALRAHVTICRSCRCLHAQLHELRQLLNGMPPAQRAQMVAGQPRLSPDRRQQIIDLLSDATQDEQC